MRRIRFTSNITELIFIWLVGVFLIIIGGIALYKGIFGYTEWKFTIIIFIGLFAILFSTYGIYIFIKKKYIKKNKELMKKIDAKIICFKNWKGGSCYFIATDGHEQFYSENFRNVSIGGGLGGIKTIETLNKSDILKTKKILKSLHIPYNAKNKKDLIKSLGNRLNKIETQLQQSNGKNLILQTEYNLINKVKGTLTNPEPQFMEFKGHKVSVGDRVDVYVDPKNSENFWVDTDFLYS